MGSDQDYSPLSHVNSTSRWNESSTASSTLPRRISFMLFPCMVFTGVICNSLIFVIMRRRRMSHLSTCYYMGILAIADTSVLLLGLSVMWLYVLNPKWSLVLQSTYSCKALSVLFYTVSDTSVWIVCMMSADRCIAVTRPLHASSICTVRRAKISVCILVLCVLLINIHFLFTHHLSVKNECTHHEPFEVFMHRLWPWIDAAVYSAVPFILLLTINLIIVHSLFQARRSTSHLQIYQSHRTRSKNKLSTSMSRKLTTMLLAVTFFFLLTSFPMVCLQIYTNIHVQSNKCIRAILFETSMWNITIFQSLCKFWIRKNSMILSCFVFKINFFLYAITGKAFRHELKRLFLSIGIKMHLTTATGDTPLDRRFLGNTTSYPMSDTTHGQRRISPATIQLLRCRTSIDSCASNGASIKRHF